MLKEVQTYDERPYVTTKEGISYAQHTSVSSKIASGHQRTFAYMAEMNKAEHFSKDFVKERVGFFIVCTKLSYASIANDYNLLFGVSGTICADTSLQQSLLRLFKFEKITYLPSMFVNALLRFNEQTDTILCDDYDEHFLSTWASCVAFLPLNFFLSLCLPAYLSASLPLFLSSTSLLVSSQPLPLFSIFCCCLAYPSLNPSSLSRSAAFSVKNIV